MRKVYSQSTCHSLDREDLDAQRDTCGFGDTTPDWELAANLNFNVTHWPYIQSTSTYNCVRKFFIDSVTNMSVSGSVQATVTTTALASFLLAAVTAY